MNDIADEVAKALAPEVEASAAEMARRLVADRKSAAPTASSHPWRPSVKTMAERDMEDAKPALPVDAVAGMRLPVRAKLMTAVVMQKLAHGGGLPEFTAGDMEHIEEAERHVFAIGSK